MEWHMQLGDGLQAGEAERKARGDYKRAFRQGAWRRIQSKLGRQHNDLMATNDILADLPITSIKDLGLQTVDAERIVGSSGRYRDFDLGFLPLRRESDNRWVSVAKAHHQGVKLPPPMLTKIGDVYFVEDGNHRISVMRWLGESQIEAQVIEIDVDGLLTGPPYPWSALETIEEKG